MKVTMGLEVPVASPTPKNTEQKDKDFKEIFSECKAVPKESMRNMKYSNQKMKSIMIKSTGPKEASMNLKDEENPKEAIQIEDSQEKEKANIITQILNMLQIISQNVQFVPKTINQLESYVKEEKLSVEDLQELLAIVQKLQNQLNVSLADLQGSENFQTLDNFQALEDFQTQIEQFTIKEKSKISHPLQNGKTDDVYTDSDPKLLKTLQLDDAVISKLTGESFEMERDIQKNENTIEVQVQRESAPLEEVINKNNLTQQTAAINIQGENLNTNTITSLGQRLTLTPQQLDNAVLNQIKDKIQIHVGEQISEIKMQLRPEHLGNVSLKMEMERGALTAKFIVESQQVKEIIESQFNTLKDVLSKQGIDVKQVTVSVRQDDFSQHQETLQQQKQNSKKIQRKISVRELMEIYGEEIEEEIILPNIQTDHQVDFSA